MPAEMGMLAPTMPMAGSAPTAQSPTWSEPPMPRQQPVSRANSSAIRLRAETPLASAWP